MSTRSFFGSDFKDQAARMVYSQLPYHPQRVWSGATFIASVTEAGELPEDEAPRAPMAPQPSALLQNVRVQARLSKAVSSDTAVRGDAVGAVLTQPLWDKEHRLVLPEGTRLAGSVMQSKGSRSFGRNGQLRFLFQTVERPGEESQRAYGLVKSAEGRRRAESVAGCGGWREGKSRGWPLSGTGDAGGLYSGGRSRTARGNGTGRAAPDGGFEWLWVCSADRFSCDHGYKCGDGVWGVRLCEVDLLPAYRRGQPVAFGKDTPLEVELQTR